MQGLNERVANPEKSLCYGENKTDLGVRAVVILICPAKEIDRRADRDGGLCRITRKKPSVRPAKGR